MIFNFLQYIQPTWYFNLSPRQDFSYFPLPKTLQEQGFHVEKDLNYIGVEAQERDLAWQAFKQGFISISEEKGIDIWEPSQLPIEDEYRFFRKNFHKFWTVYVLGFRIFSLHNPFKELYAYWTTREVKRENYSQINFTYPKYETFASKLIEKKPFISIVIPTLNRYEYLKDVFKDLENQTYKNFEVIVVDQTDDFKEDFYKGWNLDLKFWYQEEKALWKARNEAIKSAKGEYILLYDDDSLVENDWIEQHLKTLDFFNADLSSGVSLSKVGGEIPDNYSYFCWSSQLDTGNVLLKKDIFREIGLFDRQFEKQRMGDGEYGLRAYLAGYRNISNPRAKRIHLKVSEGGLRQMGSWDAWRTKKWNQPKPIPSVLYLARKYYGNKSALLMLIPSVAPSIIPYRFKKNKTLKVFSLFLLPILFPLLLFQVSKSWRLSSEKLKQGGLIEFLK